MIWNASVKLDFDEEELRFFNLLTQHAKDNIEVEVYCDQLKEQMQREGIDLNKFEALIEKMQNVAVISKYERSGGRPFLFISSVQVKTVQHELEQITCPKCKKRTLEEKVVIYCPACDYLRDKESKS